MPTLEELLRASLKGANEKFDQANKALHAAVVDVAKAVEAATGGKATVRLQEWERDETGTRYALKVSAQQKNDFRDIVFLFVPTSGFPVYVESQNHVREHGLSSSANLAAYFSGLVSDPDSPLVGYLAYLIRNSIPQVESSSDDVIPF